MPSCGCAVGLLPTNFDHIKKEIGKYRERLLDLAKNRRPVTVARCVYTPNFLQYLENILEVDAESVKYQIFSG